MHVQTGQNSIETQLLAVWSFWCMLEVMQARLQASVTGCESLQNSTLLACTAGTLSRWGRPRGSGTTTWMRSAC